MTWPFRGFHVRSLLMLVLFAAMALGGTRMALRAYRARMYRRQSLMAVEDRERHRLLAEACRSRGDDFGAAKQDGLAAYSEGWRRVLEDAASRGEMVYGWSGPTPPH